MLSTSRACMNGCFYFNTSHTDLTGIVNQLDSSLRMTCTRGTLIRTTKTYGLPPKYS
ncbi:hypothetical protein X961_5855 [Burkholderia pseudomallei MSHR5613]|nr:hypothetical protein X961_5855 [Burkholderia pseudomallei MSHR5613]